MFNKTDFLGIRTLFRFSVMKLLSQKRWIMILLLSALMISVTGYSASQVGSGTNMLSDLLDLLALTFLLPVLALIYGASMIRNEIDDRSIAHVITSPVDRRVSYLGYYLPLVAVLCLVLTLITLVSGAVFMGISDHTSGSVELIMTFIAVMLLGAVVYSSFFLLLGVVMNQPLYLGLFFVFIWEGFIGSIPGAIGEYTIRHHLRVIVGDLTDYGSIASIGGDALWSLVILIAIAIVMLVIGAYAFREKEFP